VTVPLCASDVVDAVPAIVLGGGGGALIVSGACAEKPPYVAVTTYEPTGPVQTAAEHEPAPVMVKTDAAVRSPIDAPSPSKPSTLKVAESGAMIVDEAVVMVTLATGTTKLTLTDAEVDAFAIELIPVAPVAT
jgi:hypothetical protein